jgi:hypothetical protein
MQTPSSTASPRRAVRSLRSLLVALGGLATVFSAWSADAEPAWWRPSGAYVQYGHSPDRARAATVGIVGGEQRLGSLWGGALALQAELEYSRWRSETNDGARHYFNQVALTPNFRWRANEGAAHWFLELGVGAAYITPLYREEDRHFSTRWNFADHLGTGWDFGERRQHELALRLQHFSNAGIKHPNPGENFYQLRYVWRWQ